MARLQTVVDECLLVANASIDISSSSYNELAAVNWEDQDKNYPFYLFDKKSLDIAISKFSRTNLPFRYTYNQTMYFFNTYTEEEKKTITLQAKQDALMVIAEQYFAELRARNDSGQNGFYLSTYSLVPNDEQHNDRLVQITYSVELQVQRENCDLGTFTYAGVEQPTNLTVTANSASSITLGWTDNATAETNYEVYRSADGCDFSLHDTIAANSSSYLDNGLGAGEGYAYKVRAIDATNNGRFSNQVLGCTEVTGTAPSGIAYSRPLRTGQTTSFRTGDDAWHLQNGTYDYTPPSYPVSFADLDSTATDPFLTLDAINAFGNFDRFTDDLGGQTYANDYVIDHYTGLGWYRVLNGVNVDWNTSIDNAVSSTQGGFSDWRIPNRIEWDSLSNAESTNVSITYLNYAPFNMTSTIRKSVSTTDPLITTNSYVWQTRNEGANDKTSVNKQYLLVRNHYT